MAPEELATTRQRLIDAALNLFDQRGYAGASVSAILREAGVQSGSLYHFFDSKQDLLVAVLERYIETLEPILFDHIRRTQPDPILQVFELLAMYRRAIEQTGYSFSCPVGRLALEVGTHDDVIREGVEGNFSAWRAVVADCYRSSGALGPDVDAEGLAALTLSVMEGGVMQARISANATPYDQSVRHLRQYIELLRRDSVSIGANSEDDRSAAPSTTEEVDTT